MKHECSILVVEDVPENVLILREALRQCAVPCAVVIAENGAVAMKKIADFQAENALPDLVLLDLNLPEISGQEILRALKDDPQLRTIPVIVLSGSTSQDEIDSVYRLHANAYVVKPDRLADFQKFAASLGNFWLSVATLPSVNGRHQ